MKVFILPGNLGPHSDVVIRPLLYNKDHFV